MACADLDWADTPNYILKGAIRMRQFKISLVTLCMLLPAMASAQVWNQLAIGSSSTIRMMDGGGGFSDRWLAGDNGLVAHSDASRTVWTLESPGTAANLMSLRRNTSSQVWVAGEGGVVRVWNGTTWLARNVPDPTQRYILYSRESGCQNALGDAGSLYQTCDFGVNWDPLISGTAASLNHGAGFITSRSWIVGDGGLILFSTDGGDTWVPQNSGTTSDLHFIIEAGSGYKVVVGKDGTILRSNDLGTTWNQVSLSTSRNLWAVDSSGQNGGWLLAVGDGGTVLKSTDTGATWCQLNPGTAANLYACDMVTNSEYIVAGDGGVCLRTTDGGGECEDPAAVFDSVPVATTISLQGPFPQPSRAVGYFSLRTTVDEQVRAEIFDLRGRKTATIFDGLVRGGAEQRLRLNSSELVSGTYFLRVQGETFEESRKVTVVR